MEAKDLVPGKTYSVRMDDCCVQGEFVAILNKKVEDDPGDEYPKLIFSNGVSLTTSWGCKFSEV